MNIEKLLDEARKKDKERNKPSLTNVDEYGERIESVASNVSGGADFGSMMQAAIQKDKRERPAYSMGSVPVQSKTTESAAGQEYNSNIGIGGGKTNNNKLDDYYSGRDEAAGVATSPSINIPGLNSSKIDSTARNTILAFQSKRLQDRQDSRIDAQAVQKVTPIEPTRADNVLIGAGQQYAGNIAAALSTMTGSDPTLGVSEYAYKKYAENPNAFTPEARAALEKQLERNKQSVSGQEQLKSGLYGWGAKTAAEGAERVEEAKKDLGALGRLAVDAGVGLGQLGVDAAIAAVTKGTALAPLFLRAYGGAYSNAIQEGAAENKAMLYGISSGAVEVIAERMWNFGSILGKTYGKGLLNNLGTKEIDVVIQKLSQQVAKSELGRSIVYNIAKIVPAFATEAAEEMVAEVADPILRRAIYDPDAKPAEIKDILYSGLIGGIIGGIAGGGGQVASTNRGKPFNTPQILPSLIDVAKASGEGTASYKMASGMEKRIKSGDQLTNAEVDDLLLRMAEESTDADNKRLYAIHGVAPGDVKTLNAGIYKSFDEAERILESNDAPSKEETVQLRKVADALSLAIRSKDVTARVKPYYAATLARIDGYFGATSGPQKVGKRTGNTFSRHRSYIPYNGQINAAPTEDFDIVRKNEKTGETQYISVDDFDGNTEPQIIKITTVDAKGNIRIETPRNQIIVDKAAYVGPDYKGFDVERAKTREKIWRSSAKNGGPSYDATKITDKEYFNDFMEKAAARWAGKLPPVEADAEPEKESAEAQAPIDEKAEKPQRIEDAIAAIKRGENIGVRFGDMNYKTEHLGNQGGTRGTGHYGTGVYFVGSPDVIERLSRSNSYKDAPFNVVSFDGYNLYRPEGADGARRLHDFLRNIQKWAHGNEDRRYSMDKMNEEGEYLFGADFNALVNLYDGLEDILARLEKYVTLNFENDTKAYFGKTARYDSASTLFMKQLNYDGIDVRGIEGYDNEEFGSVIYQPRELTDAGIATVKVNLYSNEYAPIKAESEPEIEAEPEPEAEPETQAKSETAPEVDDAFDESEVDAETEPEAETEKSTKGEETGKADDGSPVMNDLEKKFGEIGIRPMSEYKEDRVTTKYMWGDKYYSLPLNGEKAYSNGSWAVWREYIPKKLMDAIGDNVDVRDTDLQFENSEEFLTPVGFHERKKVANVIILTAENGGIVHLNSKYYDYFKKNGFEFTFVASGRGDVDHAALIKDGAFCGVVLGITRDAAVNGDKEGFLEYVKQLNEGETMGDAETQAEPGPSIEPKSPVKADPMPEGKSKDGRYTSDGKYPMFNDTLTLEQAFKNEIMRKHNRDDIYGYFTTDPSHSFGEKVKFLKEHFGSGGHSGPGIPNVSYDAKGIKISIERRNGTLDLELRKWPAIVDMIEEMIKAGEFQKTSNNGAETATPTRDSETTPGSAKGTEQNANSKSIAADKVKSIIDEGREITSKDLFKICDEAFGGTQAEGKYDVRMAYDILELAVNRHLIENAVKYKAENTGEAITAYRKLADTISILPTQGSHRSEKMEQYQQFSTPPTLAYLMAYLANVKKSDVILEPSAGIGGLVAIPYGWGATVVVNELERERLDTIKNLPFQMVTNYDAEQIHNLLDDHVKPSLVLMNPPFSTAAERTGNKRDTKNAKRHIEQALLRLEDNGRLIAIVGNGMALDKAAFKDWWAELSKKYNIRANIGINGKHFKKYGTTFNIQMVVIDKTGPTTDPILHDFYDSVDDVFRKLESIRNSRAIAEGSIELNGKNDIGTDSSPRSGAAGGNSKAEQTSPGEGSQTGNAGGGRGGSVSGAGNRNGDSGKRSGNAPARGTDTGMDSGAVPEGGVPPVDDGRRGEVRGSGADQPSQPERSGPSGKTDTDVGVDVLGSERDGGRRAGITINDELALESESDVYNLYKSSATFDGALKHPTDLVESAPMSAVRMPLLEMAPNIPRELYTNGTLSNEQAEAIGYAAQAHENMLPDGSRQAFFIGDGTGVGKGREISGIILHNFNEGRKKAVWVSETKDLLKDAKRDWSALGMDGNDIFIPGDLNKPITQESGILFTTYSTIGGKGDNKRIEQIKKWLGADFDGAIVFDEAHNMANAISEKTARGKTKPAAKALAGIALAKAFPKARVVFASATGATDLKNMAYLDRLGMWGPGTNFQNVHDFISKVSQGGIAAMELIARDMKAMGMYIARNLSYKGVEYDTLEHNLTPIQIEQYNATSRAWQIVLQSMEQTLIDTNASSKAIGRARGALYGTIQRFYNQLITSMSMPTVLKNIHDELEKGNSVIIQLTNTGEAALQRSLADLDNDDYDSIDVSPTQILVEFLMKSYPIYEYVEIVGPGGDLITVLAKDADGNPIISKEAVKERDRLIEELGEMKTPEGALEMLFNEFGPDAIAEITGRNQRIVPVIENGTRVMKLQAHSDIAKTADEKAFQNGDKRILVFSAAGGTGRSYHADRSAKNQQRRVHIVLQAGWSAFQAVQGFGRSHRSNQAVAPIFRLVTTDILGQKRFTSTIARRLDQLGALTKGERQAGSSGLFGAKDNLENQTARDALVRWYRKAASGSYGFDGPSIFKQMGLYEKLYDQNGNFAENYDVTSNMTSFLNRVLALEFEVQNEVFESFEDELDKIFNDRMEAGMIDIGTENYIADKIETIEEKIIRTDDKTGAETKYIQIKSSKKPTIIPFDELPSMGNFVGIYKINDADEVRAVFRVKNKTNADGSITEQYKLLLPTEESPASRYIQKTLDERAILLPKSLWAKAWSDQIKAAPEYIENTMHVLSGVLLPVWDRLPQTMTKVMRIMDKSGKNVHLGRIIPEAEIDSVLRSFRVERSGGNNKPHTAEEIYNKVFKENMIAVFGYGYGVEIARRRVSGDYRLEIIGNGLGGIPRIINGVFAEKIGSSYRYFIPTDPDVAIPALNAMMRAYVFREIKKPSAILDGAESLSLIETPQTYGALYVPKNVDEAKIRKITAETGKNQGKLKSIDQIINETSRAFNIKIARGRYPKRSSLGIFDVTHENIQTKNHNEIGVVAHELGHYLDKMYDFKEDYREELLFMASKFPAQVKKAYKEIALPGEALAEFVRLYITDPIGSLEFGTLATENFYEIFEGSISNEDKEKLMALRSDVVRFLSSDIVEKAKTSIVSKHDKIKDDRPLSSRALNAYVETVDGYYSASKMVEYLEAKTGHKVAPENNTYLLARNADRADTISHSILMRGLTAPGSVNHIAPSFNSLLFPVKNKMKDFSAYLKMIHALEWNEQGKKVFSSDLELSEIRAGVMRLEGDNPEFTQTAKNIHDWFDMFEREWLVNTGFIEETAYNKMRDMYPNYVPNFRVLKRQPGVGKAKDTKNPLKYASMKGSDLDTYDPIESLQGEVVRIVKAQLRRDTMLSLHRMYNDPDLAEGMGFFIAKTKPDVQHHLFDATGVKQTVRNLFFDKVVENLSEEEKKILYGPDAKAAQNLLKNKGLVEDFANVDEAIDDYIEYYTSTKISKAGDVIGVIDNGKPVFYRVLDSDLLGMIYNMDQKSVGSVIRVMGKGKRAFTVLTTGANPIFGLTSNIIRDIPQAYIFGSESNPVKFSRDLVVAFAQIIRKSPEYQNYKAGGGGFESMFGENADYVKRASSKISRMKDKHGAVYYVSRILDAVEEFNNLIETGPRLAEYNRQIKIHGNTPGGQLLAQDAAASLTTNFSQKPGSLLVHEMETVTPFMRAGINGLDRVYRGLIKDKENRKEAWIKAMVCITIPTMLMAIAHRDDEEYKKLPNFYKDNYWMLNMEWFGGEKGKFIRLPKTRELAWMFGATFDRAINEILDREEDNGKALVSAFFDTFMPSLDIVVMPFIDAAANRTWSGGTIVSSVYDDYMTPGYYNEAYDDTTSRISVGIANILPDIKSLGAINTPKGIEYLIKQYSGVIGQVVLPATTPANEGLISAIGKKVSADNAYSNRYVNEFYDILADLEGSARTFKDRGRKDDKYDEVMLKEFNKVNRKLSEYWKAIRQHSNNKDLTAKERSEKVREERQKINELVEAAVKKYKGKKNK